MSKYSSSVWDRLIAPIHGPSSQQVPIQLSLEQYTWIVARDVEVLLNTRLDIPADELASYAACQNSIVNFGLADFAQLCLSSSDDRKEICDRLTAAIERHEPRLTHVRARLLGGGSAVNRLSFAISGQLSALGDDERVRFNVMLEPSSLHYSIR